MENWGVHLDPKFTDLEIRIFPRQEKGYPVEITFDEQQEFRPGYLAAEILPWVPSVHASKDGARLLEALLADPALRSAWSEARGKAPQRRIRLRIDPDAVELHELPWELLNEDNVMLSAGDQTPFSRYLPVALPWGDIAEERPIRILVVISNPDDLQTEYDLTQVDVEQERQALEAAFAELGTQVQVHFLDAPVTIARLEDELRQGYHILHYLGHGVFSARRGQAALYLQDNEGHTDIISDDVIIGILSRQQKQPSLVFLATCQSAARSTSDAFLGFAPKLVAAGVPAVVAMQDFVNMETARKLGAVFYQRLAEHGMVDLALNEARGALLTAGLPDAAVPVLFMRLQSGQLWDPSPEVHEGDELAEIKALIEDAENVHVVTEVIEGDKVVNHVYNYYQDEDEHKPDWTWIGAFLSRAARSWVTWLGLVLLLAAGGWWLWDQQQIVAVSACQSDGKNFVVLVGKFEAVGTAERDVSRSMVEDLTRNLKEGLSPTNFTICAYPRTLTGDAAALVAAQMNHASVVIWGRYTPEFVQAEIQAGDTPDVLAQDILAKTVNVSVRLKNESQSSIARQVMAMVDVMLIAQGDIDGYIRGTVKLIEMPVSDVQIISTGVSARVHELVNLFATDTLRALDQINAALKIAPDNPMLYIFQAAALQRLGKFDESMDGIEAAIRRGPPKWVTPIMLKSGRDLFTGDYERALQSFGELIAARPEDWYAYTLRGYIYLRQGNLEQARADIERSLALHPQENWPYTWAAAIALRQGRMEAARQAVADAFKAFPDADAAEKAASIFAAQENNPFSPALSAFWSFNQGSFNKAIEKANLSLRSDPRFTDAYLIKGLSYCNLNKFAESEAAYTEAIALEPQFILLYLLRADARKQQGNLPGAMGDMGLIQASPQAGLYKDYVQAALQGKLSCKNALTYRP